MDSLEKLLRVLVDAIVKDRPKTLSIEMGKMRVTILDTAEQTDPAPAAQPILAPKDDLTERERALLCVANSTPQSAKVLAKLAGQKCNSRFHARLRKLMSTAPPLLIRVTNGYCTPLLLMMWTTSLVA